MKKETRALWILLMTAAIWGFAFTAQKEGGESLPALAFGAWRYLSASVVLYLITVPMKKRRKEPLFDRRAVVPGVLIGAVLFAASTLQQMGVTQVGAGKCSFLTTLYVVLVPVLGSLFFRKKAPLGTYLALLLAVPALYLLCCAEEAFVLTPGDLLALSGAVFWALHILLTDRFVSSCSPFDMCTVQFFICGLLALSGTLLTEKTTVRAAGDVWLQLAYLSVLSTAAGYTLQTLGQRDAKPAHAAIVLSMESVFGVLGGALLLGERLSAAAYSGCALMLAAVILSQLSVLKGEKTHV